VRISAYSRNSMVQRASNAVIELKELMLEKDNQNPPDLKEQEL
jgi:hypothetical protein